MFSFILGIALLQWFSAIPSLLWFCMATTIFLLGYFIGKLSQSLAAELLKKISITLFAFCLGLTWAAFQAKLVLSKKIPETAFGKVVSARGWVSSIPQKTRLSLSFQFHLKQLNGKPEHGVLQLTWYRHPAHMNVGDEWQLPLKLKHIHGLMNPGGLDYQRWAFMHGIVAKAYVVARAHRLSVAKTPVITGVSLRDGGFSRGRTAIFPLECRRANSLRAGIPKGKTPRGCPWLFIRSHPWKYPITYYRAKLQHLIQAVIKDSNYAAIITALTIGIKSLMTPNLWQVFQRTGTSHLMAISGLHVGLVAAAAYFLLAWLWRCFPRFLLYIPAQRVASMAAIVISWVYGLLVGFSLPTQRAVIMVTVLMLLQLWSRHMPLWRRLLLAFVIVVACQPLALFSASFWLSFSAVFWIAYAITENTWWRLQLAVFVGLMPLTLFYFHQLSLVSIVANMIAIPWVTILLVPLCLLACVVSLFSSSAAGLLFLLAQKMLMPLWWFLQWLSHFSFAVWVHPLHQFFVLFSFLIAVALLLSPRGFPSRYLALIFLIPVFFIKTPHPKEGNVWLTLLDVGQGLSAVIQTAHHVLVYDTGPKYPTGFDAGRSVVLPYLQRVGINKINRLMISHGDNDHIGGANWLLKMIPINKVMTSVPKSHWHRSVTACFAGESWQWDKVHFRVLSPPKNLPYEDNNSSCVLRIQAGAHSILLTGDIEKPTEKSLLLHQKNNLPSTILVTPHHGSRSSSSLAFVKAVHPRYVLIPVGFENRYRFPAPSVLRRYHVIGAQIFTTAKQGAIRLQIPEEGTVLVRTTYHHDHYWQ